MWIVAKGCSIAKFESPGFEPAEETYPCAPLSFITLHENRHAHRNVVGQPEGKTTFGRPKSRWRILIKCILRKVKIVTAFNVYKQWLFQPYRCEKVYTRSKTIRTSEMKLLRPLAAYTLSSYDYQHN